MSRLVDLSHTIEHDMITYPGLPGPRIADHLSREASRSHYAAGTEFQIGRIEMVANTGTYIDMPSHRWPDGHDLAGLPLERAVDVRAVCVRSDSQAIGPESIAGIEIRDRAVLFATGWDRHWRTAQYGDGHHPFVTAELADALVEGGAVLAGIDSVNIDDTRGTSRPVHTTLLRSGVLVVEHLTGLDQLVGRQFRFFAVPPKIAGMGTFPVRAFAIVES